MSYEDKKSTETRSPLKAAPLRYAGQSLDEEIQRILDDDVLVYLMMAMLAVVLTLHEWWRWYSNSPPRPLVFSVLAVVALAFTARKIVLAKRRLKMLRLGRDGEKIVSEYLDPLREKGYRILHDIVGGNFNIDHLLIGPKGVFTVETKTVNKPAKGNAEIDYDGTQVLINGLKPDRDPVVQAKAQSEWVRRLVKELTGKTIAIRPVVVFPEWYVNSPKGIRPEVWVLNPKALPAFIENSDSGLSDEDVHSFHAHLSRYVRNFQP